MWSIFGLKLYFGFFGIDFGSFISKVFVDVGNASGSDSSLSLLNCDGTCSRWVSVVVSLCGCCSEMDLLCGCCSEMDSLCGCSCEVDGLRAAVLPFEVRLFLGAFFPGSYFHPLAVRWSFFSATAKSLATSSCGYLELKSSFLIKKCAAAAKHLVGCLKEMPESFGWNGHGSIKLQQYSSVISSWVSLSFSNLSSVGADKCGGIFN